MSPRLPLLVALSGVLALAACDSTTTIGDVQVDDTERVSGVWEGTAQFLVDTVLVDENYRLKGTYDVNLRFDVLHDDGLAWGTVTANLDGFMIARESGLLADTFRFDASQQIVDEAYGTFLRPELELDVPWGPYEEDLWTFDKTAGRMDLQGVIQHTWRFVRTNVAEPDTFEFVLPMSTAGLQIRRNDSLTPNVPEPTQPTGIPGNGAREPLVELNGTGRRMALIRMGPSREDQARTVRTRAARGS